MKKYNFDKEIERIGSGAIKTDALNEKFGRPDLLAAWVADMDFATPDFIIEAMKERLEHPVFGYTMEPAEYRKSIIDWEKDLHGWEIEPEWISYIPGIVKGIGMVINVFSDPGDEILIMPPVYHPFRIVSELNGRKVKNIPLIEKDGTYHIDFDELEKTNISGRILIMSNPHNPGGRVWNKEELKRLSSIAHEKNWIVVSDEIHADMALWGNKHIPYAIVSDEAASHSITFCAPSKTFNIPGIVSSFSVVPNPDIREKFYGWLIANEFNDAPIFSYIATIAAYKYGHEWRKEMLRYIEGNIKLTEKFFEKELPVIKPLRPDASFLIWLDCRGLELNQDELNDLFINYAKIALNDGAMFGKEGEGFMRLNVATPVSNLEKILVRIKEGVKAYQKKRNENN